MHNIVQRGGASHMARYDGPYLNFLGTSLPKSSLAMNALKKPRAATLKCSEEEEQNV